MRKRLFIALVCFALLTACGSAEPTARPRAEQIAQATRVAADVQAAAEARAATQTVLARPTATLTVTPTSTRAPTSTAAPTQPRASATSLPTRTTVSTAPVLPLFDNLTDGASGWLTGSTATHALNYAPDGYHMRLDKLGSWLESPHARLPALDDVSIEVDVTNLADPVAGNGYGVLCRYQDADNWYSLTFGADGSYFISRMYRGDERPLGGSGPAPKGALTPLLPPAGTPARLRADCVGDTLTLSVDGQVLVQVRDTTFARGKVELYVCTCGRQGSTEARFANLVIWQPDPAAPQGPAPTRP